VNARVAGVVSLLAAVVTAASASAATPITPDGMPATTVALSSAKAGARHVVLTVKVHYEMVCGQPGRGTATVSLPAAAVVPQSIASSAVLVNGKQAPSVSVSGHDVSIAMPLPKGVTCLSYGPGTLTLTLTRDAGIGNPRAPGTYMIRVHRNAQLFSARVEISA
jgi:hypothetical protein